MIKLLMPKLVREGNMQGQHFGAKMPILRGNMWISGEAWTDTNVTRASLLKIPINLCREGGREGGRIIPFAFHIHK
jgi:hypothetical protein